MSLATTAQRELIERLLRDDGRFDMRTVTVMHRLLGVSDRLIGSPVGSWLGGMEQAEASRLIRKLKDMAA